MTEHEEGHVVVEDLRKTYDKGRVVACENIDIEIAPEELVVLLGPSGCGKTTTLRCIAGLEQVDSGRIVIDGTDVTNLPPKDRDIAFVFQTVTLFPHKSVRGNIRFGLDMKTDLSTEEKNERVQDAAELLGIGELLDRKPSALSGGQRQRVSLGRAMVMEPDAFLLDEPFSALDANLRDTMQTEIQRLQHELETAMVFVTHDQEEAMTIGDRIVVMDEGEIQQVDTPYNIYNDPANLFVAEFIGSPPTNVVECDITTESGRIYLRNDAFSFAVADAHEDALENLTGEQIFMGLRPAKFALDNGDERFTAHVDVVEPLGENDAVYLSQNGLQFCAKANSGEFTEGMDVPVGFDEDEVWLFTEDGTRVA